MRARVLASVARSGALAVLVAGSLTPAVPALACARYSQRAQALEQQNARQPAGVVAAGSDVEAVAALRDWHAPRTPVRVSTAGRAGAPDWRRLLTEMRAAWLHTASWWDGVPLLRPGFRP